MERLDYVLTGFLNRRLALSAGKTSTRFRGRGWDRLRGKK